MSRTTSLDPIDDNVRRVAGALAKLVGLKTVELGDRIGLSYAQITDRLRGDKAFESRYIARMAELFGVSVEAFYAGPSALIDANRSSGRQSARTAGVSPIVPARHQPIAMAA